MRRSYVPRRYAYCTLSKHHTCDHHYEKLAVPDISSWPENPVEPRCLDREEVMQDDFVFEPSYVMGPYVPMLHERKKSHDREV